MTAASAGTVTYCMADGNHRCTFYHYLNFAGMIVEAFHLILLCVVPKVKVPAGLIS